MVWRAGILGVAVAIVSGCGFAQVACTARTPQQALPSGWIGTAHEPASSLSDSFYRLERIVVDPELHRRWALVANCTHPERPLEIRALSGHIAIPNTAAQSVSSAPRIPGTTPGTVHTLAAGRPAISSINLPASTAAMVPKTYAPNPQAMVPVIHAGDLVRLWSSDGNVRLQMAVVSLEYGRVGQIIHLRRLGQTALLAGVVAGKDSAELVP